MQDPQARAVERDHILKAQAGRSEAFGHLVKLHQARLRAFAARYLESSHDVFDVVQDAFLSAYEHIDRFDPDREFGPWLRTICRNRIIKFLRARKTRRQAKRALLEDMLEERIAQAPDAEADDLVARVRALRLCVNALSEEQRELVHLRYLHGISVAEIARKFDQTPAAISMRLLRIRAALRRCLENRQGNE